MPPTRSRLRGRSPVCSRPRISTRFPRPPALSPHPHHVDDPAVALPEDLPGHPLGLLLAEFFAEYQPQVARYLVALAGVRPERPVSAPAGSPVGHSRRAAAPGTARSPARTATPSAARSTPGTGMLHEAAASLAASRWNRLSHGCPHGSPRCPGREGRRRWRPRCRSSRGSGFSISSTVTPNRSRMNTASVSMRQRVQAARLKQRRRGSPSGSARPRPGRVPGLCSR